MPLAFELTTRNEYAVYGSRSSIVAAPRVTPSRTGTQLAWLPPAPPPSRICTEYDESPPQPERSSGRTSLTAVHASPSSWVGTPNGASGGCSAGSVATLTGSESGPGPAELCARTRSSYRVPARSPPTSASVPAAGETNGRVEPSSRAPRTSYDVIGWSASCGSAALQWRPTDAHDDDVVTRPFTFDGA